MAVTTPNKHYFSAPAGNVAFMAELVECLCNAHATIESTVQWTVIESWDGTTREVPAGGLLSASTNAWAPGGGTPGAGSWIVLRSRPGRVAATFQVKFTNSGGTPQVQLIPYDDWVVGGGTGGSPTLPSRIITAGSLSITTGTQPRAVVWDEAMFAVMTLNTADASQSQVYVGEVDLRASEADDPRPFVQFASSAGWDQNVWRRYSPIDDTTALSGGLVMIDSTSPTSTTFPLGLFISATEVYFATASHQHFAGIARHIGIGPRLTANTRTTFGLSLGVRDWVFFRPTGNAWGMRHDGTVLDADAIRMRESYDITPPPGHDIVRQHPYLVRARP